jgi:TRAP-type C4-dicarboxylate transport system substrate-binding protein
MNRRLIIELGLAAVAVAATKIPRVFAQAKLELKASDVHPAGYPTVVEVENFGKKLERASHGRVTIKMFPSMQLGGEREAIEQARVDTIQLARVSVGALGPII